MLAVVKFNEDEYNYPCLLVLGCFDGLHLGHSELLKKAKLQAKINGLDLGVMTFTNGKEGKELYSFEERLKILENYNVKFVLKIDYNEEFKKIKPLEFLGMIEEKLNVKAYMSGKDFRFGQGAKGKSSTLKSFAEDEENGVWYMPIKDFTVDGEKVSTSHIKELLTEGDVKKAAELLGRNYSVSGTVVHGAGRGAEVVGYPTLNVTYPENKYEVKQGVYTVRCTVGENVYYGIANYGSRPTFDEETTAFEVYLDGLEGTYYDETVTVEFLNYIRDIRKFDSAEDLSAQLSEDILQAKEEAANAPASAAPAIAPVKEVAPAPVEERAQAEIVATEEPVVETEVVATEEPTAEEEIPAQTEEVIEEKVQEVAEETLEAEVAAEPVSEETAVTETEEADEENTENTDEAVSD